MYNVINDPRKLEEAYKEILLDDSDFPYSVVSCNVGIDDTCMPNEECVQNYQKSRAGKKVPKFLFVLLLANTPGSYLSITYYLYCYTTA